MALNGSSAAAQLGGDVIDFPPTLSKLDGSMSSVMLWFELVHRQRKVQMAGEDLPLLGIEPSVPPRAGVGLLRPECKGHALELDRA